MFGLHTSKENRGNFMLDLDASNKKKIGNFMFGLHTSKENRGNFMLDLDVSNKKK